MYETEFMKNMRFRHKHLEVVYAYRRHLKLGDHNKICTPTEFGK